MEPTIKDKYIILGFIGVAICLISFFITLIVSASFNQDNFVRLIVFVCSNILGWLLYLSFQTVIFDSYEIWKLKSGKKKGSAGERKTLHVVCHACKTWKREAGRAVYRRAVRRGISGEMFPPDKSPPQKVRRELAYHTGGASARVCVYRHG